MIPIHRIFYRISFNAPKIPLGSNERFQGFLEKFLKSFLKVHRKFTHILFQKVTENSTKFNRGFLQKFQPNSS